MHMSNACRTAHKRFCTQAIIFEYKNAKKGDNALRYLPFNIHYLRIVILLITGCWSAGMVPLLSIGAAVPQTASTTSMPSVT